MSFKARQKSLSLEADFPRGDSSLPEALGPTGNFLCFFVTFFDGHAAPLQRPLGEGRDGASPVPGTR